MAKKTNKPVEVIDPNIEIGTPKFTATDPRFRNANRHGSFQESKAPLGGLDNTEAAMVNKTWQAIGGAMSSVGEKMYAKDEDYKKSPAQIIKKIQSYRYEDFMEELDRYDMMRSNEKDISSGYFEDITQPLPRGDMPTAEDDTSTSEEQQAQDFEKYQTERYLA